MRMLLVRAFLVQRRLFACLVAVLLVAGLVSRAAAQPAIPQPSRDAPVYYQADNVEYDRERGVVTLTGRVEFWQGARALLADKVTYNRTTNVAAAIGNVVLLEADGQTVFSEYAELGDGLNDGVMAGLRALLPEGGRLAANGARRTDARVNELSRVVYSTCDLCPNDPSRAPLWQLRAREAIQDRDNKRIEYRDAVVDIFGIPLLYVPYLAHPDPTEKRASGILVPSLGFSSRLGAFAAVPYYWVIDGSSDATITPIVASREGPGVDLEYRHRFNNGRVDVDASLARHRGDAAGHINARGLFAIDDTWRWGFNLNRASSASYMRDFRVQNQAPVLTSQIFLEGFGQGSYSRAEARFYQGLTSTTITKRLPFVLPYYQYSFVGERDRLGGRVGLDVDFFNILRTEGANTQRARLSATWNRPAVGRYGDVWNLKLRADAATYIVRQFNQQPNYGATGRTSGSQGMPTVALQWRWPLLRDAGEWGRQTIEPIVQLALSPRGNTYVRGRTRLPNEDSLDTEFSDTNLFALNRFPGVDRLEGGVRAAVALRGAWDFTGGGKLDGQIGQAYRLKRDRAFDSSSGLQETASDVVSRVSYTPASWLDFTSRQRFARRSFQPRFVDAVTTLGDDRLRLSGGYVYTTSNPFTLYDTPASANAITKPRNEVTAGLATKWDNWRLSLFSRRDLQTAKAVAEGVRGAYEDECFILDVSLSRRYTSINRDNGATTVLFQITFKTVGQFGFNAF